MVVKHDRESLEALLVLAEDADVVLNEAFGVPTIAVDTHIFRVGNRTGMAVGSTPLAVEKLLEKRVPEIYRKVRITGLSCMAAIPASPASRNVEPARSLISAAIATKLNFKFRARPLPPDHGDIERIIGFARADDGGCSRPEQLCLRAEQNR